MHVTSLYLAYAVVLLVLLAGCSGMPDHLSEKDLAPLRDDRGHARSLSLSTPPVRIVMDAQPGYGEWYEERNEYLPAAYAPGSSFSITTIRDRQYIYNGRVYDDYERRTYEEIYR